MGDIGHVFKVAIGYWFPTLRSYQTRFRE